MFLSWLCTTMWHCYVLCHHSAHWKTSLAIKGKIRLKSCHLDYQQKLQQPFSLKCPNLSTATVVSVSTRREQEWQFSRSSLLWLLYSSVPHLELDTTVPEGTRGCWEKLQWSRLTAHMLPFMTAVRWVGICINVHCVFCEELNLRSSVSTARDN